MKLLLLFLCFFITGSIGYASDSLTPQVYTKKYMPYVEKIETTTLTLSDGTLWKKVDSEENLLKKWTLHDQVIVRWDTGKCKYILQSITENQKSTDVDLQKPSFTKIIALDEHTLTLSDGSTFSYIPFIRDVQVGNYVLMSLNENEQGKYYPYFIIGYFNENSEWNMTGEVQARIKD